MAERTNINTIVDLNNKNNYNVFLPLYIPDSDDERELEERKRQGKVRKKNVQTETETSTEQNSNMDYYENGWENVKTKNDCKTIFITTSNGNLMP